MALINGQDMLIRIEPREYPVYLSRLLEVFPNTSFPSQMTVEALAEYGFAPLEMDPYPSSGDVITSGPPEERDGKWYLTWNIRAFTEEELAAQLAYRKPGLLAQAELHRKEQFKIGFAHTFTEGTYRVQVGVEDRVNLHELNKDAKAQIAAENGSPFEFRVYENVFVSLTPEEVVSLTDLAIQKVRAAYRLVWDYTDLVRLATVAADLPDPLGDLFA